VYAPTRISSFTLSLILVDRTQKVKDARSEAAKEVEVYKAQKKEKDFKQSESAVLLFIAPVNCAVLHLDQEKVWPIELHGKIPLFPFQFRSLAFVDMSKTSEISFCFLREILLPHALLLVPHADFQSDEGATLRTRKFVTNRLLNRKQSVVDVLHPSKSNLSKDDVRTRLASLYKAPKETVQTFEFRTQFGGGKSTGFALIYDTEADLKKFEVSPLLWCVRF
jgi:ribosomal protein S24E